MSHSLLAEVPLLTCNSMPSASGQKHTAPKGTPRCPFTLSVPQRPEELASIKHLLHRRPLCGCPHIRPPRQELCLAHSQGPRAARGDAGPARRHQTAGPTLHRPRPHGPLPPTCPLEELGASLVLRKVFSSQEPKPVFPAPQTHRSLACRAPAVPPRHVRETRPGAPSQ